MKKYNIINYLKGFSIFTIVLMHSMQGYLDGIWDKAISIGGTGAHVFIFCSGFGLCLSYLNKPESYIVFLKKRLSKVYFPYIIVIALFSLWRLYTVGSINWNEVASHIFLYKMFDNMSFFLSNSSSVLHYILILLLSVDVKIISF